MERIGKQVTAAGNGIVLLGPSDMMWVDSHPAPRKDEDIALVSSESYSSLANSSSQGANSTASAYPVHWREEASARKHKCLE